jgi:uncharacterized membrane protein HdeD (DUF308 family)
VRSASVVIGVIGILVGAVWILQGAGVLPGSFMTGQRLWLFIGIIVVVIGVALMIGGLRRPIRP